MTKKLTYLDSCVLLSAFRAENGLAQSAMTILDDSGRVFAASIFSQLELLPKPTFEKQNEEEEFFKSYFETVSKWADDLDAISKKAMDLGCKYGLNALDALHVASALFVGAEEIITKEKETKPMHRVKEIKITGLSSLPRKVI